METFTPLKDVTRATFEARSTVPSSSKARVPYSEDEEYARLLSHERAARKHAERLADSHAKSTRVLEVSKTELVRKLLGMKIKLEKEEREKTKRMQAEPSSTMVIADMKKQIEVTRDELTESTHCLAEESRKSAIAAQELVTMNQTMRGLEEELRQTKQKLSETERSKHEVMIRSSNYDKWVRARESMSENRLASAEVQSANAQDLLSKLEERIAYLDRRDQVVHGASVPGVRGSARKVEKGGGHAPAAEDGEEGENKVPPPSSSSASKFSSYEDADKRAALRAQVLKNVDIAHDLHKSTRTEASFHVPNTVEHDGDLHMSEARTVLVDPNKLDPTVGAHMDYLTFKAFSSSEKLGARKTHSTDLGRASYVHQAQFASKKGPGHPIDQTVKDTHAAYNQFLKYNKFQTSDNVNATEKKLSDLVNENHQLKIGKEKAEIQQKAAVEELEDMREKLRVIRLENDQFKSLTNNQEQDLIGWKVKTFEEISTLDSNIRKAMDVAQDRIDERVSSSVLSKLVTAEEKIRKLSSCVENLNRHYKSDSKNLKELGQELKEREQVIEGQKQEMAEMAEKHKQDSLAVAEDLAEARKIKEEAATERKATRAKFKKDIGGLQLESNQLLDAFQQKLNEISIKAARVFVEADKKTNEFDTILGERGLDEALKTLVDEIDSEMKRSVEMSEKVISSAQESVKELSSKLSEIEAEKDRVSQELEEEKKERETVESAAKESEAKAESASKELAEAQESFNEKEAESKKALKEKEEKLQNTMEEASLLLQEVDELTERLVEKEKEMVAVQEEVEGAKKAKDSAEKELKTCKSSLEEAESFLKEEEEKSADMKATIKELKSTVETRDEEFESAKAASEEQVEKVTKELEEAKEEMEKATVQKDELSKELEETSVKLSEAEASCEEASSLIVELKQTHEKEKKELAENLELENQELHDQVLQATTSMKELEQRVEMEHHELESYEATMTTVKKEAEEAEIKSKEAEGKLKEFEAIAEQSQTELEEMKEQLRNANSQKQAAEERTATAISKLYDMESRVEYEKKRAEGVIQVVSQQLQLEGRGQTAALISDFARLRQQLEMEVDQVKRAELEERLDSLKLAMQYDEANTTSGSNTSFMQLENKLQTEKEIRKKLEGELKAALDKCVASEEENQMLLKEYEEVVEENKFLVSQIENLSK
ncbi:hypothetical protein A3770_12p66140 [Chloropicon primus]|uniref:Uncharacterized protein n=1 Tax=Chloropicon primus TaxID=1764295 RepID=A0A5B8MUX6_9CHLO|nr:hypothetical protein A3770_12p66140 [Chloropicon primus]|eukprot:QDZ24096.1 hypothetical protein A3770_12p66140 [Chloropicon primus]